MSNRREVLLALPLLGAGWAGLQQVIASPLASSKLASASLPAEVRRPAADVAVPAAGSMPRDPADARRRQPDGQALAQASSGR